MAVSSTNPLQETGKEVIAHEIPAGAGDLPVLSSQEWAELDEVAKEGFTENDQRDMKRMGMQQQFRRNFKLITTIGFTTCVMGTWEILLTANTQGLIAGGLAGLFWSLCWAYAGQLFVVLSMAEMAAMAPTSAGQFHWVSEFAPRSSQKILSYISGWLSTIAWQSIIALDSWIVGVLIQSLIVINDASYVPTRWQATLLIWASVIGMGLFNIVAAKRLPLFEAIFVAVHVLAFFPIIIVLLVKAPKQPASAVFTHFTDNGAGWPNVGWATLVGQVSAMFVVLGSDSVAHMAEEVADASTIVPRSMIWSFLLNVPFTFGLLITYLFCIDDVSAAVSSPTGFPFIYVFQTATNSSAPATTGMTFIILLLIVMITISAMASTSRQTFAFARENGLPFSRWLSAVDHRRGWHVPVNSIVFTCLFTMVISLINVGSTVAFNAMLSLSTVALMATYVVSVGCVTLKRLRKEPLPPSSWTLGHWGLPVNLLALVYACWSFFWSFWPNAYDVNAVNFNWACVLFVGLMAISVILYLVHARKVYEGPVVRVEGRKFN